MEGGGGVDGLTASEHLSYILRCTSSHLPSSFDRSSLTATSTKGYYQLPCKAFCFSMKFVTENCWLPTFI